MEEDLSVEDDALSAIGQNIRQLHIDLLNGYPFYRA